MRGQFQAPDLPLLIFTDLDGTLLDHDTYSCEAARPALSKLKARCVPVIPVTSKTLSEVQHLLSTTLHLRTPVIAENGGVIALPTGYFPVLSGYQPAQNFVVRQTGPSYQSITATLDNLRTQHGYHFRGFHDMSNEEVSELTGLSIEESARAKWRRCSEPFLWRDSVIRLDEFRQQLKAAGLTVTQGGRFMHVMGDIDKGAAISELTALYQRFGLTDLKTLALGDSPNDLPMLEQANIAVAILRKNGSHLVSPSGRPLFVTDQPGPEGWNAFVQIFLQKMEITPGNTRIAHG
jgi:mannosyl-3-phosphoglycerate phosphatase